MQKALEMKKSKSKSLDRYHRDVYFPDWTNTSLKGFAKGVQTHGSISFSLHALIKIVEYMVEYGKRFVMFLVKTIRQGVLKTENVFEFYAEEDVIKKACFRISSSEIPVDIVLVISADGVVVTAFVINKGDNHTTLDEKMYERKP